MGKTVGKIMAGGISPEMLGIVTGDSEATAQRNNGPQMSVGGLPANIFLSNRLLSGGAGPNSNTNSPVLQGLNPASQAYLVMVILHEMAHSYSAAGFLSGDADKGPQTDNNDLLWKKCSKTILGTPGFGLSFL